jgi:neutral ceramidase
MTRVVLQGRFVAAFASSNLGDVTPNIKGPRCQKSGKPCDIPGPSCDANELCVASGPGDDMKESTRIIAQQLFDRAYVSLSIFFSIGMGIDVIYLNTYY